MENWKLKKYENEQKTGLFFFVTFFFFTFWNHQILFWVYQNANFYWKKAFHAGKSYFFAPSKKYSSYATALPQLHLQKGGGWGKTRAVASLTVPGGQEFHFPLFFLKFWTIYLIFPQTLLIFFLILVLLVGGSPTREGPGHWGKHYFFFGFVPFFSWH